MKNVAVTIVLGIDDAALRKRLRRIVDRTSGVEVTRELRDMDWKYMLQPSRGYECATAFLDLDAIKGSLTLAGGIISVVTAIMKLVMGTQKSAKVTLKTKHGEMTAENITPKQVAALILAGQKVILKVDRPKRPVIQRIRFKDNPPRRPRLR